MREKLWHVYHVNFKIAFYLLWQSPTEIGRQALKGLHLKIKVDFDA